MTSALNVALCTQERALPTTTSRIEAQFVGQTSVVLVTAAAPIFDYV